jgi:hypothetical protein
VGEEQLMTGYRRLGVVMATRGSLDSDLTARQGVYSLGNLATSGRSEGRRVSSGG